MWNFWDLINIDAFWQKLAYFSEDRWKVSFYCKDCREIVDTNRINPNQYIFECKKCSGKNIVIGTYEWLKSNYKIKK